MSRAYLLCYMRGLFKVEHKHPALKTTWSSLNETRTVVCQVHPLQKFSCFNCKWNFLEENSMKLTQFKKLGLTKQLLQNNQLASTTMGNGGISPPRKVSDFPEREKLVTIENTKNNPV